MAMRRSISVTMLEIRASSADAQAILQAAVEGKIDQLELISDECLRRTRCSSGCAALHYAAGANQLHVMRYLVQQRALFSVDVRATKKAAGRSPLHYACRNGCLEAAVCLVNELGAAANPKAKHGITPFQLAVWRNHLDICQWLVSSCQVDPCQVNDFDCGAVHWLGIAPVDCADDVAAGADEPVAGQALLPTARWLATLPGMNFHAKQRQGHTPLHKAAFSGHLVLCQYLHDEHGLWDDCTDDAGNYSADLCDMANTDRHRVVARYLREQCSRARATSCSIIGVSVDASEAQVRKAYLSAARLLHPDKKENGSSDDFDRLQKAYRHLTEGKGRGSQSNPAHSLKLMLQFSGAGDIEQKDDDDDDDCFKARLIAVVLEYGDKGLDLSNLKKKWRQVWPDKDFPVHETALDRKVPLSSWIRQEAGDVVELRADERGCLRVHAKNCSQAQVAAAAVAASD